jgi:hypothetical protein
MAEVGGGFNASAFIGLPPSARLWRDKSARQGGRTFSADFAGATRRGKGMNGRGIEGGCFSSKWRRCFCFFQKANVWRRS